MLFRSVLRLKRAVKAVFYTDNFFVDLGFEYVGPIGGHNIQVLCEVLEDVRKLNRPVVVHVITRKGKGYDFAETYPDSYHGVGAFSVDNGIDVKQRKKSFTECFSDVLLETAQKDSRIIAITAAMKTGSGLSKFAKNFPDRFYDVGIAEEHAVTFAAGLAANGLRPIVAIYSTFIQRAVDQIIHDAALQKLPVIFMLDRAGLVNDDGETHQGLFDISIFRSTPNMTILAPASENELRVMFDWVLKDNEGSGPVIIRYPKNVCPAEIEAFSRQVVLGRGVFTDKSSTPGDVCLAFTGSLYNEAAEAASILNDIDIKTDLYNLRFLKPVDEEHLTELMNSYKLIAFAEEGIKQGGFGEYICALAHQRNCTAKIILLAVESGFLNGNMTLGSREELLSVNDLDGRGIAKKIKLVYDVQDR